MQKKYVWMLAAILTISGASVLTSCSSNDDNPAQPELNVQQLVGKWLYVEADGEVVETEESSITTYVMEGSTLKAYTSMSQQKYGLWACKQPTEVKIDGDKITLTMQVGDVTTVEEMTNITVSGDDLRYTCKYTVMKNGEVIDALRPYQLHCVKVHDDYSQIIIGRWEGTITSDEPGFVPQPFCEAYLADGKNIAYNLIDGQWVQEESEYDEYFVDGNLMITRWKLSGRDEERQNCIIESYDNGTLIIKEVVVRGDKLYTETSTLKRIDEIPNLNVAEKIIGKWMSAEINGKPFPTDNKGVYTFLTTTTARMSSSVNSRPELGDLWHDLSELDVNITGNVVTLTHQLDEHKTMTIEMAVTSINAKEMQADVHATLAVDGTVARTMNDHIRYERIEENYRQSIQGIWEGRSTGAEGSEFDDGENHRWEYLADGTFRYYHKVDGQWQLSDDVLHDYFVDGTLLCTRWKNAGEGQEEHREWWEIESIKDGVMKWKALRQREDGTTYTATFEMTKVQ